jgi:cytochrome oxidase Cu insertion factor (SCO1/SenC/PrrC family)
MSVFPYLKILALPAALLLGFGGAAFGHEGEKHDDGQQSPTSALSSKSTPAEVKLVDLDLVDRTGKTVKFASEAVGDRIVVMDFVYTNCKTLCPVLSQMMAQVQDRLDDRQREAVRLVTVSVDPGTDTPERMDKTATVHGAGPDWLWLTGFKPDVDRVLVGLGVYTPDFTEHPSVVLVGDGRSGNWTRFYGFPSTDQIYGKVEALLAARAENKAVADGSTAQEKKAREIDAKNRAYFTDLPVVTHRGEEKKFYTDLLRNKIVLLSVFFIDCKDACPLVNQKLSNVQEMLSGSFGRDIFFISVTLDPERDTPDMLKEYAANFDVGEGWDFVTGDPERLRKITYQLGQISDNIEAHMSFLAVGDVKRGLWKKFPPYVREEVLVEFLRNTAAGS